MLTSKERAYLKGLANNIPAIFQIGKEGLSSNLEKQLLEELEARELIKINVLNNSLLESKEVGQELANNIEAELVQVIGNKIIIYKESKENPKIKL
jgi:RNA-binding protein